jgi:hypothetical protein
MRQNGVDRSRLRYCMFAVATTRDASAELRTALLECLVEAVDDDVRWRGRCRDTDVRAATRVRAWYDERAWA